MFNCLYAKQCIFDKRTAIYWYKLIKEIGKKLKYNAISSLCKRQRLILSYYHILKL